MMSVTAWGFDGSRGLGNEPRAGTVELIASLMMHGQMETRATLAGHVRSAEKSFLDPPNAI